jgi:hypothetical protein
MCGFGSHFFVQGAFTAAGGVSTPNNLAIFNTTTNTWNTLSLPNYNNMTTAQGMTKEIQWRSKSYSDCTGDADNKP